jgi:hypothetical protein
MTYISKEDGKYRKNKEWISKAISLFEENECDRTMQLYT